MFPGSLRAFDETARTGSIRKASQVLGVAPSSVSRQISILEAQMGTALFCRRAGGLELTHAGKLVAEFARSVLVDYDTLRTDLNDVRGTQRRHISLAMVDSIAHCGPLGAIASLLGKYPTISFTARVMSASQTLAVVREGQYDIGLTFCGEPDARITTLARIPEPIMLVVRADHPLAGAARVELAEIAGLSLALPDAEFGLRQILDRAGTAAGLKISPVLSSNVCEVMRDFVRLGAGCAILPWRATRDWEDSQAVRAIPILGAPFSNATIDIVVLRARRLPRIVKTFADSLVQAISATSENIHSRHKANGLAAPLQRGEASAP